MAKDKIKPKELPPKLYAYCNTDAATADDEQFISSSVEPNHVIDEGGQSRVAGVYVLQEKIVVANETTVRKA